MSKSVVLTSVQAADPYSAIRTLRVFSNMSYEEAERCMESLAQNKPVEIKAIRPDDDMAIGHLRDVGFTVEIRTDAENAPGVKPEADEPEDDPPYISETYEEGDGSQSYQSYQSYQPPHAEKTEGMPYAFNILGQTISFAPGEIRYIKLLLFENTIQAKAQGQLESWYKSCRTIENVIDNGEAFTVSALRSVIFEPLYQQLIDGEIYDVSREAHRRSCEVYQNFSKALDKIDSLYSQILQQQANAEEYRAARKAGRSRWQGGGFGLSGALEGAATAGALNALSGLGHSLFNAVGNVGSAASAAIQKEQLYNNHNVITALKVSLRDDVHFIFTRHFNYLNQLHPSFYIDSFSRERARALLENAKRLPEKRGGLMAQSFRLCPWDDEIIQYIFINFEDSRRAMVSAAQTFSVDLNGAVEEILSAEYTQAAQDDEEEGLRARARVLAIMSEYNIASSSTLNQIEEDLLARVCSGVDSADEETCEKLRLAVSAYPVSDMSKAPFLKRIQERVEEIWSAEDGEIFDNLYLKTDITNEKEIASALAYIRSKGRTSSSEKYEAALNSCNSETIRKARLYQKGAVPNTLMFIAVVCFVVFLLGLILSFLNTILVLILSITFILCIFYHSEYKSAWKVLTMDGTVIHDKISN